MNHSLKKITLFGFISVLILLLADPSHADLSFKVKMKMGPVSMTSSHCLKGNKMLISRENGLSAVYLLDEGKIVFFDRARRVYSEFPIDSEEGQKLRNLLREDSLAIGKHAKIESLGKKGKVHGLDCEYKSMKLDYGGITFDYTACVSKDPPPEIKRFNQIIGQGAGGARQEARGEGQEAEDKSEWVITVSYTHLTLPTN